MFKELANEVKNQYKNVCFSNTCIIGVQHLLPSTVLLFKGLINIGFKPGNMFFKGKPYSTVTDSENEIRNLGVNVINNTCDFTIGEYSKNTRSTIKYMWEICMAHLEKDKSIKNIIILDEGGRCIEQIPRHLINKYEISAIEQTRAGLYNRELLFRPFSIIQVATCALKREFESNIIAGSILRELFRMAQGTELNKKQFGIIGHGAFGKAITNKLNDLGFSVFIFDEININKLSMSKNNIFLSSSESLFRNSDFILGCTGNNTLLNVNYQKLVNDKWFVSCSSEDKEFKSLIDDLSEKTKGISIDPF